MITFDVVLFIIRNWTRLLIVYSLLVTFSILSFLFFDDAEIKNPSVWDFFISTFTHQFVSMIFFPALYSLLIVDLALHDLMENYTPMILARVSSRMSWYTAKVSTLFYAAFLFVVGAAILWLTVGSLKGLPWDSFAHPAFQYGEQNGQSPWLIIFLMIIIYIGGLTAIGSLVLWLSLWLRSSILTWLALVSSTVVSMMIYNAAPPLIIWVPFAQLMFKMHFPYYQGDPDLYHFTVGWSGLYLLALFLLSVILGWIQIRRLDLIKKA